MNIEDILRETLSDMAAEERPPSPDRFLRPQGRRPRRRGLALATATAVAAMVVGSTLVVQQISGRAPGDTVVRPAASLQAGVTVNVAAGMRLSLLFKELSRLTGRPVAEFERAAKDGTALGLPSYAGRTLEGFAFPGAYEFSPAASPAEILRPMVARFEAAAEAAGLADGARRAGRTPLEIVTIASIVQAEAGRDEDMAKISRVIHNRLNRKMLLQVDSTVLYGLNKYGVEATLKEIRSPTPYNTYRRRGLPPGPIGSPGAEAIRAALHPARGTWLYYVATDPKERVMKFATTEAERAALIEEYRKNLKGR
ncbi:endolytic transglycosylase MltG [Nonomuraea angiospora]|uniref:endolytic transglycosylase MltG n=1 Tax=Nonomuraea angiospora TaxID=46172 RepID=UPI0029B9AB18|nr:endolytic transglycosylase MltG [Nonomuraea angiospora]MDX3101732.1 endolytic transglycosylase MltG [Nonomuraea angiospora]